MPIVDPVQRSENLAKGTLDVLVYTARCNQNGKLYVGITSRPFWERVRKHLTRARKGSGLAFHKALRKYGPQNFVWEIQGHGLSWEEACQNERALIAELGTSGPKGYNVTAGGDGTLGMSPSQDVRDRVSATLKAWHASPNPEAEALRERMARLRKETPVSLQTRMRLAVSLRGRVLSEESRAKLSASKLLYPESTRVEAVKYALEHGYRAAERVFGIHRPTIRRWSKTSDERVVEKSKMRERNRTRQYGYAFPVDTGADPDPR